jgi:hypothetical protein
MLAMRPSSYVARVLAPDRISRSQQVSIFTGMPPRFRFPGHLDARGRPWTPLHSPQKLPKNQILGAKFQLSL